WPQRLHERDQRVDLRGTEVLAVGRHVAATLQHLTNELITGLARRDAVQRRAAAASLTAQAVAGAALLVLQHEGTLQLERRAALDVLDRGRGGGPCPPLRRPRNRPPPPPPPSHPPPHPPHPPPA